MRALPKVSMRSVLIAGVASVGIAATLSNGPISPPAESMHQISASSVAPARISHQDVELMAYIPVWSDAMSAVAVATELIAPLVDTVVLATLAVANGIPVVNVVSRQIQLIYVTLARPIVVSALTCGALFLGYLTPVAIGNFVSTVLASLANFVQAEVAYFAGGGWIPFGFGAVAAPFAAAARSLTIDSVGAQEESTVEASDSASRSPSPETLTSFTAGVGAEGLTTELIEPVVGAVELTDEAPVSEEVVAVSGIEPDVAVTDAEGTEIVTPQTVTAEEGVNSDAESQATTPVSTTDSDDKVTDAGDSSDSGISGDKDRVGSAESSADKDESVGAPAGRRFGSATEKSDSSDSVAGRVSGSAGTDNASQSSDSSDSGTGKQAA